MLLIFRILHQYTTIRINKYISNKILNYKNLKSFQLKKLYKFINLKSKINNKQYNLINKYLINLNQINSSNFKFSRKLQQKIRFIKKT